MQKDFKKGVDHYLAERFNSAARSFRKVIKQQPAHGDALHLLGLIALRTGQAKAGERRLRQAIAAAPGHHIYHGSLGAALREQGRPEEALAAYGEALALRGDYAMAWQNSGQIEADLGRFDNAVTAFQKSIELNPEDAAAHFGLAHVYGEIEDFAAAERFYGSALALDPDDFEAWNNLGNIYADSGRLGLSEAAFEEAVRRCPDDATLPLNMAKKMEAGGRWAVARAAYGEALARDPENRAALAGLAALTAYLGDDGEAGELFGQLARQDPDNPRTHAAMAVWHESAGRLADARAAADRALAFDDHHEEANLLLAQLDRRAGDLEAARARLDRFDGDGEAGAIAFELGRVLDRLGDGAVAIEAFERGNAALDRDHNNGRFDGKAYAEMVAEIGRGICADQAAPWAETSFDDGLANPIFFIGFPRSGTTLMEQMLDAHQGLISVEEQPMLEAARHCLERDVPADYPALLMGDLSAGLLSQARRAYWDEAIAVLGEDAVLVKDPALVKDQAPRQLVDKLPLNIVHLALIRRLFPKAKVLVALRDPRDVVLSCFMQSFAPNDAMVHFGDLGSSADLYVGVMSNWLRQRDYFGANMYAYKYEDLVADPGTVMRNVLAFLGLPWQESVLDYRARQRNRLVATPSYQDVREKIYDRAVARWRIYGDQMAPVQDRLAPFVKAFGY